MDKAQKVQGGIFIVFEGIDGSGKSTQSKMLKKHLEKKSYKTFLTQEPSNSAIGKLIKKSINSGKKNISSEAIALLFAADRAEHIKKIKRELEKGKSVICDRYYYSSLAYQGASGLSLSWLMEINKFAIKPSIAFYLDIPPEKALERIKKRKTKSYFEKLSFLSNVRKIYKQLCREHEELFEIDASKGREEVHREIVKILKNSLSI